MIDILLYTKIIVELYVNFCDFFIIYKVNTNCHKLLTNFFINIFLCNSCSPYFVYDYCLMSLR